MACPGCWRSRRPISSGSRGNAAASAARVHNSHMNPDFRALRRRFPVLERKTYLNSGSYCALADTVRDAINGYMEDRLLVGANWDVWVTKNEAVRAAMARVLRP